MCLVLFFTLFLGNVGIPVLGFSKKKSCHVTRVPIFRTFPIVIAMLIAWLFCYILTVANVFPEDPNVLGYRARTDINSGQVSAQPWVEFPIPGQWGMPKVTTAGFLGMCVAFVASVVESVGDYYACASLSGAPPPPVHAINRGIAIEGVGCILSGAWGTMSSTVSYSTNIGILGITKVGSRVVIQVLSLMLLISGFLLKIGAFFSTLPEPVIGGVVAASTAIVAAVGISVLRYVDMTSTRNLTIVGISFWAGIAIPSYMQDNPGIIQTGSQVANQVLEVILTTGIFLGGLVGFVLDNIVPGTDDERGITRYWSNVEEDEGEKPMTNDYQEQEIQKKTKEILDKFYDFPFGMSILKKLTFTKYVPTCPTFVPFGCRSRCCRRNTDV